MSKVPSFHTASAVAGSSCRSFQLKGIVPWTPDEIMVCDQCNKTLIDITKTISTLPKLTEEEFKLMRETPIDSLPADRKAGMALAKAIDIFCEDRYIEELYPWRFKEFVAMWPKSIFKRPCVHNICTTCIKAEDYSGCKVCRLTNRSCPDASGDANFIKFYRDIKDQFFRWLF